MLQFWIIGLLGVGGTVASHVEILNNHLGGDALEDVIGNPALLDVVYRVVDIQHGKEKLAKGRYIEFGLAFIRHGESRKKMKNEFFAFT